MLNVYLFFHPHHQKEVEAFVGNDVAIDCKVPKSQPPALLQFYKDDKLVSDLSLANVTVLNHGETLLLTGVSPDHAGRYTCGATNHITSQSRMAPGKRIVTVCCSLLQWWFCSYSRCYDFCCCTTST